jgi:hypothetical protein
MSVMVYDAWEPLGVRRITSTTTLVGISLDLMDELNHLYMGHHRDTKYH